VFEDNLAQRYRALADSAPAGIDRGDGERTAKAAALPGPAARTLLERAVEPRRSTASRPCPGRQRTSPRIRTGAWLFPESLARMEAGWHVPASAVPGMLCAVRALAVVIVPRTDATWQPRWPSAGWQGRRRLAGAGCGRADRYPRITRSRPTAVRANPAELFGHCGSGQLTTETGRSMLDHGD
jgi:hypothetical protein